ncbi:MAG: phosphopyruvate hydratase [Patescibacteria group bacterium]|nr:phosphopyruvate hydratase [Patescibacteria group bacterium]
MSSKIKTIKAREILDSRGEPTIETKIVLDNGLKAKAAVPSGASTGKFEMWELRDNDPKRYLGKGVLTACKNVNNEILEALKGMDVVKQKEIDERMMGLDGTENKSRLGANAILSVSLGVARVAAQMQKLELWQWIRKLSSVPSNNKDSFIIKPISEDLPMPCFNLLEGGKHADNRLSFQEFWAVPAGAGSFTEAVRMGSEVFHCLRELCKEKGYNTNVGDEGGLAPNLDSNQQAVELVVEAMARGGFKMPVDFVLGLDVAASSFFEQGSYLFKNEGLSLSSDQMVGLYCEWVEKYPISVIEDGLAEDDWQGWISLVQKLGEKVQIIGDDLLVTNLQRLKRAIQEKAANAILIKLNQIGTLTETLDCIREAQKNNFDTIISHRSGETCDTFIADLAVGTRAGQIKTGSLSRSERICKYNRLMEIEEQINNF